MKLPVARRLTVVVAAAFTVIAGCGSGDSAAPSAANASASASDVPALSANEFRDAVSSICVAGDAKIESQVTQALGAGTTPELASALVVDTVIPTVNDEIGAAEALRGPADLEQGVREMTAAAKADLDHLRDVAAGPDPLSAFAGDPFADVHAIAARLGFSGCKYVAA